MKIKATMLLVMVLILTQIILTPKEASAAQPNVKLSSVKGEVFLRNGGGLREVPAVNGTELVQGDWLRTGKNSTATLSYEDGTEATLGASSYITIQQLTSKDTTSASEQRQDGSTSWQDGHQSSIQLWSGSIWSNVKSLINSDDKYEIKTPTAVMGVRGTLYLVSVDQGNGSTQSDVIDGTVGVSQNNEGTHAAPIQLVTMGQTLRLNSVAEPMPDHQAINPQELIKNTQPEILVHLINDITERTMALADQTKEQQQTFSQTGNIEDIKTAIGTTSKLSGLASFSNEFMSSLQNSDKLEAVIQVLQDNHQSLEQVQKAIHSIKAETEVIRSAVVETAKNAGVSQEQIDSIGQAATGDSRKLSELPIRPPSSSGSGKGPSTPFQVVTNVQFSDSDTNLGKIGGNITWTEPTTVTGITEYVVYFLDNSNGKVGGEIGHVARGNAVFAISPNTVIPEGCTKLGVFTKNGYGENTTGAAISIDDYAIDSNDTEPILVSAEVPSANPNKVVVTFSKAVTGVDGSGFGILIDNQPAQIVNVTSSSAIVTFTIQAPVCSGAVVQICYDASVGNVVDLASTPNKLASFPLHSVINYSVLSSTVTVSSAVISDSGHIVLTMSGALSGVSGDPIAFTVVGANTCPGVAAVAVSGTSVTLTLSEPIAYGETITLNYAKTGTTDLTNGTLVANFTGQTVTNNIAALAPTYESATTSTDGTKVLVTFNKAMANPDGMQAQFNVIVDGAGDVVTAAALNDNTKIIELTLTSHVTIGQSIQVAYTAGTVTAEDTGALATFLNQAVINVSILYISSVNPVDVATVTGTAPVLPETVTATLSDGTTSSVSVTWSPISENLYVPEGTFTVTGTIANTSVTASAIVFVGPDLTITTTLTATPITVARGSMVNISGWTVKYIGSLTSADFTNGFYLSNDSIITTSDTYLDGNGNIGLADGEVFEWGSPNLLIPSTTPPGIYYVGVLVDISNAVTEGNETNNYASVQITVN